MPYLQSRKLNSAAVKPSCIRLMQYSILVLAGPESDCEMLNSSWNTCSSIHCVFLTNLSLNWRSKRSVRCQISDMTEPTILK